MCLQQTDLTSTEDTTDGQATKAKFVVSLFGARDDIKAHYTADRARVCGATWGAFFENAGATAEDVWGGVDEADRKLWSVSSQNPPTYDRCVAAIQGVFLTPPSCDSSRSMCLREESDVGGGVFVPSFGTSK